MDAPEGSSPAGMAPTRPALILYPEAGGTFFGGGFGFTGLEERIKSLSVVMDESEREDAAHSRVGKCIRTGRGWRATKGMVEQEDSRGRLRKRSEKKGDRDPAARRRGSAPEGAASGRRPSTSSTRSRRLPLQVRTERDSPVGEAIPRRFVNNKRALYLREQARDQQRALRLAEMREERAWGAARG